MKLNKIFNTLSIAAVALFATACADTDAQYSIPQVGAPEYVSITPASGALVYGAKTITVTFDKNINFMTKNTSQITLNGVPVKKALVLGASNTLTISVDVDFNKTQKLVIPAGLITGPQGDPYNEEISMTWTITDLPSNKATEMTKKLGWGWNLGNHFDTSDMTYGYWDGVESADVAPFTSLVAAGAKTVRIPATWTNHIKEGTGISDDAPLEWKDADYLDEVAGVVDKALAAGLNVILNTHHDSFEKHIAIAATNPVQAKEDSTLISQLWTAIATKFKDYDADKLIFETFNEVHGAAFNDDGSVASEDWSTGSDAQFSLLNKWNQYALDAIRKTGGNNTNRWVGVSGYAANIEKTINYLQLPKKLDSETTDDHVMVAVHSYDPGGFCQSPYDAKEDSLKVYTWGHNAKNGYSVSGANEDYIINLLYQLRTKYIEQGIPCYLGEYGCVYVDPNNVKTQTESNAYKKFNAFRKYYFEYFCRSAYLAGIPMMIWDNNVIDNTQQMGGDGKPYISECFGMFDHSTGDYLGDGADVVPMMIKACTSDSYDDFPAIWAKSPVVE